MGKRLKILTTFLLLVVIAALLSWHSLQHMNSVYKPIKVGVSAGPQSEIMSLVKTLVAKDGLDVQIIEFTDYSKLNDSLYHGKIRMNSFQHQPYLTSIQEDYNHELTAIAKTILSPMGIYSKRIKNLSDVPSGGKVAIPKDLTNGSRALLLLEKTGLITCRNIESYTRTVNDIVDNPLHLTFLEIDSAQMSTVINSVDLALINVNYVTMANLIPVKDALALEDNNSPYVMLLVARTRDTYDKDLEKIIKAYHSEEVKNFVKERYQGTLIPAW
ncbi:MetQ/NlpA family ABC transporter substrate-binding protein [Pelosinus sp. IPA-1]|uniref:MetQ/NlpA family ABC transporter substrate-binding protein n=1 Tax=Pelosinus sp. IPA-1 TaxID=3029569 RepID=UPI00243619A8|nr:MetQ/NlpA family ABC transporter substrate-binding protein [Pelosinus sp. IPA-1]GMA97897.1 lipoprotein [Pelosinus sp. IPA-1]